MIGYVKGILEEADDQCIIVDNHGIGYRIFVPGSVFSGAIPIGQEVKIYTYLNVKEDAMQLYGFATRDDLRVFKLLLGVNGIGPKAGLGSSQHCRRMICGLRFWQMMRRQLPRHPVSVKRLHRN